jgi:hypothetical protein
MRESPLLCLLLAALAAPTAAAAPWAEVDALWIPGDAERWQEVERTGEATRATGGDYVEQEPLYAGMALSPGDYLVVRGARVRIQLEGNEQLVLEPDTALTLEEDSVLQDLGEIFYQVRGAFRVRYGTVEAAVEGTRFVVAGEGEEVVVTVRQGAVRVTADGESVLLRRGQQVRAALGGDGAGGLEPGGDGGGDGGEDSGEDASARAGGVLGEVAEAPGAGAQLERSLGEPRLSLGLVGGAGLALGVARADGRLEARYRLNPRWRLVASSGAAAGDGRLYLPKTLGLERRLGPLGFSLSAAGYVGPEEDLCEGTTSLRVIPGVSAGARLRVPLAGAVALEVAGRAGWVQSPTADVGLGVSYGF